MDRGTPQLSIAAARRIALAAQGFGKPRPPRPPSVNQIAALVERLGAIQLDSVNVFGRSHYMPVFSRLGPYDRARLDRIAGHGTGRIDRRLVEYWAHEASLIPIELHPLFRWRMADVDGEAWGSISRIAREQPDLVAETLELVAEQGPIRARDTGAVRPPPRPGHMWNWHEGKVALENLFFTGRVAAARRVNFERLYDTVERVVPAEILDKPTPDPADAQRELVRIAARALGVATEPDLGDYFRLPRAASKARVAELVASGELSSGRGRGLDRARLPLARRPPAAPAPRPRAADAVRLAGLVPTAHRAAVRLPLPDRDLYAGGEAHARLLRAAVPARRDPGRPRRSQVRSPAERLARPGRVRRGRGRPRPRRRRALGRAASWSRPGSTSSAYWWRRTVTCPASWLRSSSDGRAGCEGG